MLYQRIDRKANSFQQSLDLPVLMEMCARAFGCEAQVIEIKELPWGSYNNTYRVTMETRDPAILRVAPKPERHTRLENMMMRNSYAAVPYLAPISYLLPRVLFADFTHQLIDRDYLFESLLSGIPAPEAMGRHALPSHAALFKQIGEVAREIHKVGGPDFGPIAGPWFPKWSEALAAYFRDAAFDLQDAGHNARDTWELANQVERVADILDEIVTPRLLHGDGWTANFLVDGGSPVFHVTGLCDWDRAGWGDPLADWSIQRALLRPGTERDAFWVGYGQPSAITFGMRQKIYRGRYLIESRIDLVRPGRSDTVSQAGLANNYAQVAELLGQIRT